MKRASVSPRAAPGHRQEEGLVERGVESPRPHVRPDPRQLPGVGPLPVSVRVRISVSVSVSVSFLGFIACKVPQKCRTVSVRVRVLPQKCRTPTIKFRAKSREVFLGGIFARAFRGETLFGGKVELSECDAFRADGTASSSSSPSASLSFDE